LCALVCDGVALAVDFRGYITWFLRPVIEESWCAVGVEADLKVVGVED
jgi:hypothetical protein